MEHNNIDVVDTTTGTAAATDTHRPAPRRRRVLIAAGATAAAVLLAGGAFYAGTQVAATPKPTADEGASAAARPQPDAESAGTDWDNVVALNKAMDARDLSAMRALIAPGSPADRWLAYYSNMEATRIAAGVPATPADGSTVYDEDAGTITTTGTDGSTLVTKNWVTDEAGLITSWSDAAGVPIAERLWTENTSGSGAGQTVTITGAFRTSGGLLNITVDVVGDAGADIDFTPVYVGPDGVAREPAYSEGPSTVTPGAVTKVVYTYEAAGFGGKLVYDAWNSQTYANAEITIPVK